MHTYFFVFITDCKLHIVTLLFTIEKAVITKHWHHSLHSFQENSHYVGFEHRKQEGHGAHDGPGVAHLSLADYVV